MVKIHSVSPKGSIKINGIRKMPKTNAVTIYVPAASTARVDLLNKAVEVARYNLGIDITVAPIDTRAEEALSFSNLTDDMVAQLLSKGFSMNNGVQMWLVQKDIRAGDLAWCFGATHGNMIILSDNRVWRSHYSDEQKKAMLVYLIEHEIGHSFHAADDLRASGIYDMHCTNPTCAMQQVSTLCELAEKAQYNLTCRGRFEAECFCPHCGDRFWRYHGPNASPN